MQRRKRLVWILAFIICILPVLWGCDGSDDSPDPMPDGDGMMDDIPMITGTYGCRHGDEHKL